MLNYFIMHKYDLTLVFLQFVQVQHVTDARRFYTFDQRLIGLINFHNSH